MGDEDYDIDCSTVESEFIDCTKFDSCAVYAASDTPIMNAAQLPGHGIRESGLISCIGCLTHRHTD